MQERWRSPYFMNTTAANYLEAWDSFEFWFSENRPAMQATHVSSVSFRRLPALHAEHNALPLPAVRPSLQSSRRRVHCSCSQTPASLVRRAAGPCAGRFGQVGDQKQPSVSRG